jgi:hypothetical protein
MSQDRKKPGVTFWITLALVAVLVGYPLSAGPAFWIYIKTGEPLWAGTALETIYWPLSESLGAGPRIIWDAFTWYMHLWGVNMGEPI